MAGSSKNLGQVAGLYIGTSAPTNKALIWYDTSSNVHKTFDVGLNAWTVLQPQIITPITYSALVSRASGQGLTQGQWFKITDRSNALALAITATKVQYVNNNGVPVVDDLGTHVMYNVTSENLIIDDVTGVYDATTNKLRFSFSETTPVMNTGDSDVDYVLGEQKRGNTKTLHKFRLSSLLSAVTGNDISWNGGFFLNFYNKLKSYFDTTGGVASHAALEEYKTLNNQAIEDMTQTAQDAIQTVGQNINQATAPAQIYGKKLPIAPTDGVTADIAQGDTLSGIVVKIHRWINKFKKADGIAMPANYAPASTASNVNNNDNVSTAIGKLSYLVNHITNEQIVNGSISTEKIAALAVTTAKLANLAVTAAKIADEAVTTAKLGKKSVTQHKIAYGVQPSDICRLDIEVSWPATAAEFYILNNMSVGFNLGPGNAGLFAYAASDANNPYRLSYAASPYDCPLISFAPVIAPQNNVEHDFSIAAPMLHYKGHYIGSASVMSGMYFQSQMLFSQALYDSLYDSGIRYVRVTVLSVDVYDNTSIVVAPINIEMHRVNIWGFPVTIEQILAGTGYHMVVGVQISFVQSI